MQEALASGADPLRLAVVFKLNPTTAMAYANIARTIIGQPCG